MKVRAQVAGSPLAEQSWVENWREVRPGEVEQSSEVVAAFATGGSAIIDFLDGQRGSARYPSLRLIPEAWAASAGDAYQTVAAHPDWFAVNTAPAHRADLAGLMAGANEFLALRAALTLIDHQAWEEDFADVYVLPRHGPLQAMILPRMMMQADARKLAALDAGV